ncbi:MAG: hypothetical protein H6553_05155 [Chitinophagales bacterium]|nr:hypothetical protein [Chitinophagales bacterium]
MEFLFVLGAIAYYIYKVYQETQKRNQQSTPTNTNKPKKKTAMQSIEDLLKELEQKSNPQQEPPKPKQMVQPKKKVVNEPVSEIDTLNYDDVFADESKIVKLEDKYESIMDTTDSDNIYDFEEIDDYDSGHSDKHRKKTKVLAINGKKIKAKDAFVYSLIFDRKY